MNGLEWYVWLLIAWCIYSTLVAAACLRHGQLRVLTGLVFTVSVTALLWMVTR